jgi:hypothetical protein
MRIFKGNAYFELRRNASAARATGAGAPISVEVFDIGYIFGSDRCRSATRTGNSVDRRSDKVMLRAGNHAILLVTDRGGLIKFAV